MKIKVRMKNQPIETIKITDFNIASILLYNGIDLLDIEKDPKSPQRSIFIFPLSDDVGPLINSFWNRELGVEPLRFIEVQKYLKSRLHSKF